MKINRKLRPHLAAYVAATKNEIAVDDTFFRLMGVTAAQAGHLPRTPRWLGKGMRVLWLTRLLAWGGAAAWLAGGAIVLFALQWRAMRRLAVAAPGAAVLAPGQDVVVGFSSRVADLFGPGTLPGMPDTWIRLPWVPLAPVPPRVRCIELGTLLSRAELWHAFRLAVRAVYVLRAHRATRPWVLQSYTAFHWFCACLALERLTGTIVIAEHFDRWAVLADTLAARQRARPGQQGRLTLVQHGTVSTVGQDASPATALQLPTRLRALGRLLVYDAASEAIFRQQMLSPRCARRLDDVTYFQPAITLAPMPDFDGVSILFVGHPLCEALHRQVVRAVRARHPLRAFYKPHPRAPMSGAFGVADFELIADPGCFPRVDLLVSYPSTLVREYAGQGIDAAVHPINLAADQAGAFVEQVLSQIARVPRYNAGLCTAPNARASDKNLTTEHEK